MQANRSAVKVSRLKCLKRSRKVHQAEAKAETQSESITRASAVNNGHRLHSQSHSPDFHFSVLGRDSCHPSINPSIHPSPGVTGEVVFSDWNGTGIRRLVSFDGLIRDEERGKCVCGRKLMGMWTACRVAYIPWSWPQSHRCK